MEQKEAGRWLAQARWDLKAAADSAAAGNYEWACFQSQQAAEKALKSFLYLCGADPEKLHSVRRLLRACAELRPEFGEVAGAAELDKYYIPTRYPNGLPDDVPHEYYTREVAEQCQSLARSVIEFVERFGKS